MNGRCAFRLAICGGTGIAFSAAQPAGIMCSVAFPALVLNAKSRREAFYVAGCYYAGASWPVVTAVRNFFGADAGICDGILLWSAAAFLLSSPWLLLWTRERRQLCWRAPLCLLLTVVPPMGLIGWASPLTAAGYLFPGTSWFGVLAVMMAVGSLAAFPKTAASLTVLVAAVANFTYSGPAHQIPWEGINTHFGGISHERTTALKDLSAAETIQRLAFASSARVVVFPEAIVPNWGAATDAFWCGLISQLSKAGKTIIVGSKISVPAPSAQFSADDFAASIAILRATRSIPRMPVAPNPAASFRNVLIMRGADKGLFEQRVPVPLGMWKPMNNDGVQLRLTGSGVLSVARERAAILICYEQLLSWPILTSMMAHPTVLVAVANDYWAGGTTIPEAQLAAVRAWARLISIPYVSATNL